MLRDLAAAAGMSAAKAHRYLVSFQRLALVVQDDASTRYDLGPAALKLGLASLSRLDAVKLARQRASGLLEQIGHTIALAVWGNHGPTIVHWEETPQAVTVNLRLGDVMPLLSSATGRCFAAFVRREAIAPMLKEEIARAQRQGRKDMPATLAEARTVTPPAPPRAEAPAPGAAAPAPARTQPVGPKPPVVAKREPAPGAVPPAAAPSSGPQAEPHPATAMAGAAPAHPTAPTPSGAFAVAPSARYHYDVVAQAKGLTLKG